jgi:phenylalanyl-tRNA synthetase alpha chain
MYSVCTQDVLRMYVCMYVYARMVPGRRASERPRVDRDDHRDDHRESPVRSAEPRRVLLSSVRHTQSFRDIDHIDTHNHTDSNLQTIRACRQALMQNTTETAVLRALDRLGHIDDSGGFASELEIDHNDLVGVLKSLESYEFVSMNERRNSAYKLTDEGRSYVSAGASPEAQVFKAVADGRAAGTPVGIADLKNALGKDVADVGFKQAMQQKWVSIDKSSGRPVVVPRVDTVEDAALRVLEAILENSAEPNVDDAAQLQQMTKRKLVVLKKWSTFGVGKGPKFALERKKQATDLTSDMIKNGTWKDEDFKEYNFEALGLAPRGGYLHPLLKVRTQFRKIFTNMGFEEMPTNNYVESSFWNFDALFQPQQHPARDAHDTFFLTRPALAPLDRIPADYLARVRETHENGGYGSIGYGYSWSEEEARKNLLRTHTTAVSSRMLYTLAQDGFKPAKYFSIDRVFRNESIDRTHLAEFHQVEGVVCDVGLNLGHLIGVLKEFFERLGLGSKLRFKPAFNPYTEPSMEIFSYSEELDKWMEVGNSGMFRPEMLRPMGLPEGVNVIAWGLSLERPTMILYGIDNIRDLFGHKVSLQTVKENAICRMGM